MRKIETLQQNFHCVKCRGTKSVVNKVSLSRSGISKLIPLNSGKYLFLTCVLCGYTEVYDLSLYECQEETDTKKIHGVQEA